MNTSQLYRGKGDLITRYQQRNYRLHRNQYCYHDTGNLATTKIFDVKLFQHGECGPGGSEGEIHAEQL